MSCFSLSVPQMSMVDKEMLNFMYDNWRDLLHTFNRNWVFSANHESFGHAVHERWASLKNCWRFIDCTLRRVCRPGKNQ